MMIQFGDIKACSVVAYHYQTRRSSIQQRRFSIADLVNQPGDSFSALTSPSFASLADFNAAATADALKWTDLEQNVVYQILSTRTVNTQHCQSVILSLQKDGGSSFSACACGMLSKELLQNPMIKVVCSVYWEENEQGWLSLQFVSTASVDFVNLFVISLCNICRIGILFFLLSNRKLLDF